jgi:hypothetical protein
MKKLSRGHVLTGAQVEKINEMVEYMIELHKINDDEDGYMADTLDGYLGYSEDLLIELGLVKRKIFR